MSDKPSKLEVYLSDKVDRGEAEKIAMAISMVSGVEGVTPMAPAGMFGVDEFTVKVTYFKPSGKYYSEAIYKTKQKTVYSIFDEFKSMLRNGIRPGLLNRKISPLVPVSSDGLTAVVDLPDHPQGYPAAFIGKA